MTNNLEAAIKLIGEADRRKQNLIRTARGDLDADLLVVVEAVLSAVNQLAGAMQLAEQRLERIAERLEV